VLIRKSATGKVCKSVNVYARDETTTLFLKKKREKGKERRSREGILKAYFIAYGHRS